MRRAGAVLIALASATVAFAGRVSTDVAAMPPGDPVPVIVQYTQTPGGWIERGLPSLDGIAPKVPAGQIGRLAADPRTRYISADRTLRRSMDHTAPAADAVSALQYGVTGPGVTIPGDLSAGSESSVFLPSAYSAGWGSSAAWGVSSWMNEK